jgi:anti-sigma factor RsiW
MTMHDEWTDKLSDYLDGELSDHERRDVATHIADCPDCARTLDELRAVVVAAQSVTPSVPPIDSWKGIAARINSAEGARPVVSNRWDLGRRFSFTWLELAAASLLLIVVSGGAAMRLSPAGGGADLPPSGASSRPELVAGPVRPGSDDVALATISFDETEYDAAVADLEHALQTGRGRLDPTTVKVVEDNLAIIDQAVAEARQALVGDPANGYLSGYLVETRRRKLDLLRQATALTEELN